MATIVTRAAKGSPLTHEEVDANFTNLNDDILGFVGIPTGVIAMWSGSVATIPSGWAICDGNNGTPNLTGRFVIHADADTAGTYNVGGTGGAATVALTEAQLPSHTHGTGNYAADSGGAHTHTATSGNSGNHTHTGNTSTIGNHTHTGNTSNTGAHSHSGSTSNTGAHSHNYRASTFFTFTSSNTTNWNAYPASNTQYANGWTQKGTASSNTGAHSHNFNTSNTGAHSHSFTTAGGGSHSHSFTTAGGGDHSHTITVDSGGAHTHTISGASGATGSGSAHENLPPYYALAYIMKT